jgi:hypothetical protein
MRKARSFRAPENYRWIWTYDDQELAAHLEELIRDDGRIDMDELHISAQKEVIYLEGALPSEPQHQMLLNFLTDIAGIQEIIDHLEIQRLAWERARTAPSPRTHRRLPRPICTSTSPTAARTILTSPRRRRQL